MGIRSDVAVCLKAELLAGEEAKPHLKWLARDAHKAFVHPEGVMYAFEDIKWYTGSDKEIDALYKWLGDQEEDDSYLIVTACHDYPESTEDDRGGWHENPWNVYRVVNVRLEYDETDELPKDSEEEKAP